MSSSPLHVAAEPALKRFSLAWLAVGLISLAVSGLFSIVVAVAWHPALKHYPLLATLFHRSLVAHVNLSITVWFVCCLFLCWSAEARENPVRLPYFDGFARFLTLSAVFLTTISSLDPAAIALMSNYVPMLAHPLFYLALGCLSAATFIKWVEYAPLWTRPGHDVVAVANRTTHVMIGLAGLAFALSASGLSDMPDLKGELFYELLFWGGGHVLQFIWVQLMLVAWALIIARLNPGFTLHRGYRLVLWVNLLCVLTTPIPYLLYTPDSADFRVLMTQLMAWVCGLSPLMFITLYLIEGMRGKYRPWISYRTPIGACLYWSLILFMLGGAFASMISGINVKIPAHYHGSLLGVTVALMGLSYLLMSEHGYHFILHSRMARWQPAIMGVGQVMHVVGLFWSGGYGVQRKSPDAISSAMSHADLALRVQSMGGGFAIIGGVLFLIVMLRAWRRGTHGNLPAT